LLFENAGRKSDLAFSGTFQSEAGGVNIDARVASNFIVADDVRILLAALAMKSAPSPLGPASQAVAPAADPEPATEARDTVPTALPDLAPLWKGVNGQLVLALKKVVYRQFEVNDIAGELKIGPDTLALDQLRAVLGSGGEARLTGAVNFAGNAPRPYSLKADVAISDVDSAPLFRALDPSKPPTVEGKFNLSGQFAGRGLNAADLGQRAQGDATLTSKSGIFRGLAKSGSTQVVSGGLSLGGLLGKSKQLTALGELITTLQEFPYDQINVQCTRGQSLDVQLKNFSVISQQLRLTGTGEITYEKGKPVLEQSLAMQMQIGVRGDIETLMATIGKTSDQTDELGYTKVDRPIKIGGTPANPDTSDLYAFLKEAGASALGRSALHLLGIFDNKNQ
jgi:hypothetical protein